MRIVLGRCGDADCALTLVHPNGRKEYGIESEAWLILAKYWNIPKQSGDIPDHVGDAIFKYFDEDALETF